MLNSTVLLSHQKFAHRRYKCW